MPLFHRHTAEIASPREVGVAHITVCGRLCAGVDATSVNLNAPLPAAVDALPKNSLLQWDADPGAAGELLGGWIDTGPAGTSMHQRYIFGHSIFRAALDEGARGHVPRIAISIAAGELEALVMTAINDGNTEFAMLTGNAQLEQFGKMLGDYQILSGATAALLLAALSRTPEDELQKDMARALIDMKRDELITLIKRAREQKADDATALQALERYEAIARAATKKS
jgi:hypothetical protein